MGWEKVVRYYVWELLYLRCVYVIRIYKSNNIINNRKYKFIFILIKSILEIKNKKYRMYVFEREKLE